ISTMTSYCLSLTNISTRSSQFIYSGLSTIILFFSFTYPSTPTIYTLSLHDALPISDAFRCATCYPARAKSSRLSAFCSSTRSSSDRKSTRLNSSHVAISYAVFCLKKKKQDCVEKTDHEFGVDHDLVYL